MKRMNIRTAKIREGNQDIKRKIKHKKKKGRVKGG